VSLGQGDLVAGFAFLRWRCEPIRKVLADYILAEASDLFISEQLTAQKLTRYPSDIGRETEDIDAHEKA
jgi:hypothetical protein